MKEDCDARVRLSAVLNVTWALTGYLTGEAFDTPGYR